jgi:UDP-glucose:(heptosyl)LPS alpha-1,3-glucosyltransferase
MLPKPRIALVSPFLDKRHGTERCVVEELQRLADEFEIHVYSNRVEDLDLSRITWHRIPNIPGPHLLRYLWWFVANQLQRWRDRRFRGLNFDAVYSPGLNCLDANVVIVHIVFTEFVERVRDELRLRESLFFSWPRVLHRRLYYALICMLERRVYPRKDLVLGAVSRQVADQLARHFGCSKEVRVLYPGVDSTAFNPQARPARRAGARNRFGFTEADFVLLLIGNGWKNKGLPCLLEAMGKIANLRFKLLVVGSDDRALYKELCERLQLVGRVHFLEPAADIVQFYAAADTYVGPSLDDSFGLPILEAMSCGLPVITSRRAGVGEIMTHEHDGLILEDPGDSDTLAKFIRQIFCDAVLRQRLGENAAQTAARYTWDKHAIAARDLFDRAIRFQSTA